MEKWPFALTRMETYGLTDEDVDACLENPEASYTASGDTVFTRRLEDGRLLKVRVRHGSPDAVVDAFVVA